MEIIQNKPEKIILRIKSNDPLSNALRRSVSEVPILAVDEVEIFKNDSALYDEVLAHRIGLIPLKTEKSMNEKTKIDLKLSKTGPCIVYASDFKGPAEVVFEKIPITMLGEDHKLELVATATLGKGINHAKYIPGLCYYRSLLKVKSSSDIDKIVEQAKSPFKPEKKSGSWLCDLNEAEIAEIESISKDAISDADETLFIIESFGNMDAKDIMIKAISALEDNLDETHKALK